MNRLIILGILATSALAVPMPDAGGSLDCLNHNDALTCLAVKTASVLGRAARSSDIQLIDGLTFVRDGPVDRSGKALESETEVMNALPREATDRIFKLANMLYENTLSFLKSHSLKMSMPEGSVARALEEGRAKIKNKIFPIAAAIGAKLFALIPIALGGLALLVFKALFVGKIALLLAGILAFQKLFGAGGAGGNFFNKGALPTAAWPSASGYQSWSSAPAANSQSQGYYRSLDVNDAHDLAYSAQAPNETE